MEVWDPIGVRGEPNAESEYDGYIGEIYGLLVNGARDENLADHLWRIATEQMGLSPKRSDMADTVKALRQIPIPKNSK